MLSECEMGKYYKILEVKIKISINKSAGKSRDWSFREGAINHGGKLLMIYGIDSYSNVSSIVNTIKNNGYSFVARYYSDVANSKRVTAAEIAAISGAGLKRVVIYQNKHNSYEKFSSTIADHDAADAISQAKAVGQNGGAIYFAVDFDASASQVNGNIKSYFQTLKTPIARAGYTLGVYGSSLTCKTLKEAGIVTYTWLAMSSGWGYGTTWSNWNIHQTGEITIGGVKCDKDEANAITGIGAW